MCQLLVELQNKQPEKVEIESKPSESNRMWERKARNWNSENIMILSAWWIGF